MMDYIATATVIKPGGVEAWSPGDVIPGDALDQAAIDHLTKSGAIAPGGDAGPGSHAAQLAELKSKVEKLEAENAELKAKLEGSAKDSPYADMTKDELKAMLTEKGIEYPERINKDELIALIPTE